MPQLLLLLPAAEQTLRRQQCQRPQLLLVQTARERAC
jgi:hypothetical protein